MEPVTLQGHGPGHPGRGSREDERVGAPLRLAHHRSPRQGGAGEKCVICVRW
jgi:hypothetical protein